MDGLPQYHRPAPTGWYRMLFLSTGFVIGAMCLWAFVQKRNDQRRVPAPAPTLSQRTGDEAEGERVLQQAPNVYQEPWRTESPARAAIASAKLAHPASAMRAHSATWQAAMNHTAQQATFVAEPPQTTHVSKVPIHEHEPYIPLPDVAPVAPAYERVEVVSHQAAHGADAYAIDSQAALATAEESVESEPLPAQPHAGSVIASANDSFWNIADRVYGDPRYYIALFEHNRSWIAFPDQIEQGFSIMTPPVEELHASYSKLCPELSQ